MYKLVVCGGDTVYCSKCGNRDKLLFAYKNGKYYCRACLDYLGSKANINKTISPKKVVPNIDYKLSKAQFRISKQIINSEEDIYISAVCGSGKTEIVFNSICEAISRGERVGFVTPRREIVKEIHERLSSVFPTLKVVSVYGGHHKILDGDIIVLTAHQCFRYPSKFGLLILDEYDAFPLKGDEVLLNIVKKTSFRKRVYLSATFTDDELLNKKSTSLNRRYHKHDLPVPCVVKGSKIMQVIKLFSFIIKYRNFPKLIFVPTIKTGKTLAVLLFIFKPILFTSKVEDKNKLFSLIKTGKKKTIICTTILERGITLKNLQVAVYNANHRLFDYQTLIQIAGRVGRKKDAPLGKVIFFAENYTNDINRCLEEIVNKNNEIKT